MSDILYDGVSFASKDTNFMDYVGLIWKDAENAVDDQSGFKVSVPEERPEITLTISTEAIVAPPQPPIIVPPVTPPVEPPVIPPIEPPVTPPVEPPVQPPVTKIVCEDGTEVATVEECKEVEKWGDTLFEKLLTLIGVILTALGVQWKRGILGIVKYHWKAGRKAQAMKTLFTLVKNAKAGKYDKK